MRNYGYTYRGGPLIQWGHGTPVESRAADSVALGSLAGSTLHGSTILPAPGAPEPIGVSMQAMGGCSCTGSCGCGPSATSPLSDFVDEIPGGYITLGIAAFFAWKFFKKKR